MTGLCSRRTLLTIAGAAAVSSITAAHAADGKTSKPAKRTWPDMPTVPTDFNAERCLLSFRMPVTVLCSKDRKTDRWFVWCLTRSARGASGSMNSLSLSLSR